MKRPSLSDLRYNMTDDSGFVCKDLNLYIEDLEEYIDKELLETNRDSYSEGYDNGYIDGREESDGK